MKVNSLCYNDWRTLRNHVTNCFYHKLEGHDLDTFLNMLMSKPCDLSCLLLLFEIPLPSSMRLNDELETVEQEMLQDD